MADLKAGQAWPNVKGTDVLANLKKKSPDRGWPENPNDAEAAGSQAGIDLSWSKGSANRVPNEGSTSQSGPKGFPTSQEKPGRKAGPSDPKDITDEYMNKAPKEEMPGAPKVDEKPKKNESRVREGLDPTAPSVTIADALEYDSSEDTELSDGLDTLQHSHLPPHDKQPDPEREAPVSLPEAQAWIWKKMMRSMQEAGGGTGQFIRDYINSTSEPSYEGLVALAAKQGIAPPSKVYFKTQLRNAGGVAGPAAEEIAETIQEPFDASKAPAELQALLQMYAQASEEEASVNPSVEQKYDGIYSIAYRTSKGRALKKHAFICGSAGIGKTYTVLRAVEKGAGEAKKEFAKYRGSIGKSLSDILAFLYIHRDNFVVLLDDCDGFLTGSSADVINTLKAAMDTDEPLVSTGGPGMRKMVAKKVGFDDSEAGPGAPLGEAVYRKPSLRIDLSRLNDGIVAAYDKHDNLLTEERIGYEEIEWYKSVFGVKVREQKTRDGNIHSFINSHLFEGLEMGEEEEEFLDEEGGEEEDAIDLGADADVEFPANFLFNSGIIFVSNMMQSDVPEAIASRCNVKELFLTRPEIMVRIEQILPQLLKNETAYSKEEMEWAKQNVFKWMTAVVHACELKAPLATASGAMVPVHINVPITFRMFNDFVDGWMVLADEIAAKTPGAALEVLEQSMTLRFISQVVMPAFRGDLRKKKR